MDYKLFSKALVVIRGRVMLRQAPQDVIKNGREVFSTLEEDWQQLHTKNRYSDS